ncbi:MAG: TRAP-type C4-dicarboxylate transport system permease small subunit [Thermoproteota archaeon]|jgi:TRAP-type C4-dicarboxylate transport system permease small subunit
MNKFFDKLTQFEKVIAGTGILLIAIFVVTDIFSREIFRIGIPWAQKSSVYLMIWAGFLGAALTSEKAAHLRPEIADKLWARFGLKGELAFVRIQNLLIATFSIVMAYFSVFYAIETKEFGDINVIIKTPVWVLQLVLPYTFISMSLRHLRFVFDPELAIERRKANSL